MLRNVHQNGPWDQVEGRKETQQVRSLLRRKKSHKRCLLPSLCGKCFPGCLLPSLCGECIHFGLGFGTTCCFKFHMGSHPTNQLPKKCMHRRGGQNQKWPTSGQGGYITPAAWGVPTASERGDKSELAQKWARWLHNPGRLGGTHRFRAGGKIRSGPKVGKMAT